MHHTPCAIPLFSTLGSDTCAQVAVDEFTSCVCLISFEAAWPHPSTVATLSQFWRMKQQDINYQERQKTSKTNHGQRPGVPWSSHLPGRNKERSSVFGKSPLYFQTSDPQRSDKTLGGLGYLPKKNSWMFAFWAYHGKHPVCGINIDIYNTIDMPNGTWWH